MRQITVFRLAGPATSASADTGGYSRSSVGEGYALGTRPETLQKCKLPQARVRRDMHDLADLAAMASRPTWRRAPS
jgi:hypothetical protein